MIIFAIKSSYTTEDNLIPGKKESEAERYVRETVCDFEDAKEMWPVSDEQYTYEDYVKDFELDYLGWDGVPDAHIPGLSSEKITETEPDYQSLYDRPV